MARAYKGSSVSRLELRELRCTIPHDGLGSISQAILQAFAINAVTLTAKSEFRSGGIGIRSISL
jgi:hypothetical protein